MEQQAVRMPLLGDSFPQVSLQTTQGMLNLPGDLKGFVVHSFQPSR